jgi:hypothetical protein
MAMSKRLMSWLSLPALAFTMLGVSSVVGAVAPAQARPACAALVITGHPFYPPVAWAAQGKIVGAASALVSGNRSPARRQGRGVKGLWFVRGGTGGGAQRRGRRDLRHL